MEFEKVKELIETINLSDISLFEFKTDTIFVKMDKSLNRNEKEYSVEASNDYKKEDIAEKEKLAMDINEEIGREIKDVEKEIEVSNEE